MHFFHQSPNIEITSETKIQSTSQTLTVQHKQWINAFEKQNTLEFSCLEKKKKNEVTYI